MNEIKNIFQSDSQLLSYLLITFRDIIIKQKALLEFPLFEIPTYMIMSNKYNRIYVLYIIRNIPLN